MSVYGEISPVKKQVVPRTICFSSCVLSPFVERGYLGVVDIMV